MGVTSTYFSIGRIRHRMECHVAYHYNLRAPLLDRVMDVAADWDLW